MPTEPETVQRPSEDELIARYFGPLAGAGGLGLLDDAAIIVPSAGQDLIVTVDALVAGIHFLPDDPPDSIAAKALGVNLSDLAAKGAEPIGYLLALALPADWTEKWLAVFCRGLGAASEAVGCHLLGGDTVRAAGALTISITAFGQVPAGRMVRRTTAHAGDLVCVTGTIGDATLGLALLDGSGPAWESALDASHRAFLVERYRRPQPRNALSSPLRDLASAAMDVSDGLAGDARKMLKASGVTGAIDLDRLPLSPAARAALMVEPALLDRIAGGGDDYEILFTLPPGHWDAMARAAADLGLAVTAIGKVRYGDDALSVRLNGSLYRLTAGSFQHFGAMSG